MYEHIFFKAINKSFEFYNNYSNLESNINII